MLGPLTNTIQGIVNFTWPMVLISVVIMVSVRVSYLIKNHANTNIVLYKEILMLVFAIYILCLFQIVTFQDSSLISGNNYIPFKEILRYNITSRLFFKNVIGNMIMFLPFGFFISYYLDSSSFRLPLILTLIASAAIEIVQSLIGRVFDIDDIILNLIGGLLGYMIYHILRKIGEKYPKLFHNEWFLNILSIISLVGLVIILIY